MPAPEINVRLTADGVQDVVNAFKRVQQESKSTREEVGLLGEAGQQLKDLIPLVTIGAAVAQVVELGKNALDTSISIGKLSEKTGASAGTLSVLVNAAHDVGVSQEDLGNSLVKLARAQQQAAWGSVQFKQAFKLLGISMADVQSKDPAAMFVEIAQKLQQMPDGATKAALTMQLLGRTGTNLIPVLNDIGQADGFDEAKKKAQSLGLYLSDGMVADALQAEKAIADLQDVSEGFALRFMSGFTPQMTGAVVAFSNSVSESGDGIKNAGTIIGTGLRWIVGAFVTAGQTIGTIFASLWDGITKGFETVVAATQKLLQHDFFGAAAALQSGGSDLLSRQGAMWSAYGSGVAKNFAAPPAAPPVKTGGGLGATGDGSTLKSAEQRQKEFEKLVDARAAYQDQVANAELQKQKARDQQADAEDQAMYQQGLLSLSQYYDERAQRISKEADAEQSILEQKLQNQVASAAKLLGKPLEFVQQLIQESPQAIEAAAGANATALKMLQNIAATKAQIDQNEIQRQTKLFQNDQQRHQAEQQATEQVFTNRQKLFQLQGMTSQAQQEALDKELYDTEQLLQKLGVAEAKRQEILSLARTNGMARNQMGALSQAGGDSLNDLQMGISDIQDKAAAGAISDLQATAQIYALEKQRLPNLQQIAQAMQDVVDDAESQLLYLRPGSDEYKAQVQVVQQLQRETDGYTKEVSKLADQMEITKGFAVQFQNIMMTQGTDAMVTFFDDIGTGSKSAAQAFADLGKSFEQMIVHMIDQMILYYAMMALIGWIAPGSSLYTSLSKAGPFGGLTGHQAGGWTGNGAVNRVSGVVHGQEFVVKAGPAAKYRPLLEAMNAAKVGSITPAASYGSLGGSVNEAAAAAGASGPLVQLNVDTGGQPASQNQRTGPGGMQIIDLVIGKVAADISAGGKVGQSIQSTYTVSRRGTRRG